MQPPIQIPPLEIWPDRDTKQSWLYLEGQAPVDFTRVMNGIPYSGQILILRCGSVIWNSPVDLAADGSVSVIVPAAVGMALRGPAPVDATGQIIITAPEPDLSLTWVFPVSVYEVYA